MAKEKFGGRFKQTALQKEKGKAADKAIKQAATVVAAAAGAAAKEAAKPKAQKAGSIFSTDGASPEYKIAVAAATGNMEGLSPGQIETAMKLREESAREEAERAEKDRLEREAKKAEKAEARERAKAEGKPRRFPFFGKNGGGE